jgi:hypothetical protein
MENPYQSPSPTPDFSDRAAPTSAVVPGQRTRGLVGHVRVVSILMIVQGILSLLMGLMLGAMAIFMGAVFTFDPPPGANNGDGPSPMVFGMIMGGTYLGMGLAGIIPGIMQIYSGFKTYQFQKRTLAIVSVCSGMATVLTCYCSVTAIALMIYGLIVLLDQSVREAFELAKQGHSADQIDLMFNPLYAGQLPLPPKPAP